MVQRVVWVVSEGGVEPAWARYAVLERAARLAERHGVTILAWSFDARSPGWLVEGTRPDVRRWARYTRVGCVRHLRARGQRLRVEAVEREPVSDLTRAVAALHRRPLGTGQAPLASPWSSHRDLLRLRRARFYDRSALAARVDPRLVHAAAGGGPLPRGWPPSGAQITLDALLRIASAVRGVLPGDRRAFRLFAHLARRLEVPQQQIADALALTPRRIRQLLAEPEPLVGVGLRCLGDPRLARVP